MPSRSDRIKRMVAVALLTACALAVGLIESAFPLPFPGMRLGLANVFPLAALLLYGAREAVAVALLRLFLVLLLTGNVFAAACSGGGLSLSLPLTIVLYHRWRNVLSVPAISVASAFAFNVGQVAVVALVVGEPVVVLYLPLLLGVGAATGWAVGFLAEEARRRLAHFYR